MESRQHPRIRANDLVRRRISGCPGLLILSLILSLLLPSVANAQSSVTITQLFGFPVTGNYPYGFYPSAPLLQASDGNLYGTAHDGGDDGSGCVRACAGTVFRLTPQGEVALLYTFAYGDGPVPYLDGQNPAGGLAEGPDGYLYGVTTQGGVGGRGTIYKISPSGSFQKLYDLCCSNFETPVGNLVVGTDGALYGVINWGGAGSAPGIVYKITTDGVFTKLTDFTTATGGAPAAGLVQASDGSFYGLTAKAIYRVLADGELTAIYTFGTIPQDGFEGSSAPMIQAADGYLYGVTYTGGVNHAGIVFRISITGNYQKVFDLNAPDTGVQPTGLVQASDGNLWGTTANTGNYSLIGGAVYAITTTGTLLQSTFLAASQAGLGAAAPLIQASDGMLYGTACCLGAGTVFVVDAGLAPPATLAHTSRIAKRTAWTGSRSRVTTTALPPPVRQCSPSRLASTGAKPTTVPATFQRPSPSPPKRPTARC
jgi:uncharacterized repeat protein (TIGR03803 family)